MKRIPSCLTVLILSTLSISAEKAEEKQKWEFFHGPNRDNKCLETGLLKKWPKEGPKLVWKYSDCGHGYAMTSFAEEKIFTVGDFGNDEMVFALDMDGKLLWKTKNGKSWKSPISAINC